MKNRNFLMSDETHKRLKAYAAYQAVPIGEAIKILLDFQQIPVTVPGPNYRDWLVKALKIQDKEGTEAAERWIAENPYIRPNDE